MEKEKKCSSCRRGEIDNPADVFVRCRIWTDYGNVIPYRAYLCEEHLEVLHDVIEGEPRVRYLDDANPYTLRFVEPEGDDITHLRDKFSAINFEMFSEKYGSPRYEELMAERVKIVQRIEKES